MSYFGQGASLVGLEGRAGWQAKYERAPDLRASACFWGEAERRFGGAMRTQPPCSWEGMMGMSRVCGWLM